MIDIINSTFPKNLKNIAIKMSGGADSSLAAYLIALYSKEKGLNLQITPLTIVEEAAPFQLIFVKNIVSILNNLVPASINQPEQFYFPARETKIDVIRKSENTMFEKGFELVVSGVTKIPDVELKCKSPIIWPKDDDRSLSSYPYLWDNKIYTPLVNMNKKGVAELYQKYKLMESLFPYTRSCVKTTTDFSKHCGECWWCKEREWAFGKL